MPSESLNKNAQSSTGMVWSKQQLYSLSDHELKELSKEAREVRKEKYSRGREYLRGDLPKAFTRNQLIQFFSVVKKFKHKLAFSIMFFLGLRPHELAEIRYNKASEVVVVPESKGRKNAVIPVYGELSSLLWGIQSVRYEPVYINTLFTKYREELGDEFNFVYAKSKDGRNLYQFTSYTLRHTAGNLIRKSCGDPYAQSCFLRHSSKGSFGVTGVYMHYSLDELREVYADALGDFFDVFGLRAVTLRY